MDKLILLFIMCVKAKTSSSFEDTHEYSSPADYQMDKILDYQHLSHIY